MVDYTLCLHWKQGDDFAVCLEATGNDVPKALRLWAQEFRQCAEHCEKLADAMEGHAIEAEADTHHIGFYGDTVLLKALAKKGLLCEEEIEDDEA